MKILLVLSIICLGFASCDAMQLSRIAYAQRQKNNFSFSPIRSSTVHNVLKNSPGLKNAIQKPVMWVDGQKNMKPVNCDIKKDIADGLEAVCFGTGAFLIAVPTIIILSGGAVVIGALNVYAVVNLLDHPITACAIIGGTIGSGATIMVVGGAITDYLRKK